MSSSTGADSKWRADADVSPLLLVKGSRASGSIAGQKKIGCRLRKQGAIGYIIIKGQLRIHRS